MELRGGVYGYNVEFHGITFFEKTGFLSVTNFSRIDFFNHVSFLQTNFGHTMNFHHCHFHKSCDFGPDWVSDTVIPTHFGQHTTFFNCEFFDFSDFRHSVSEYVSFTKTKFKGFADFSNATFEQRCDFSDCRFEHPTKFRNAKFKTSFPIFSGAILHQVTIFTAKEECWPVATEAPTEESRGSLAIIRHTVGKQGLPEDEHYFFRREMAFAARIGSPLQRLPYQAFGALSDFGYSLAKPTLWLAAVWFVGFLGYSRWLLRLDAPLSDTPAAVTAAGFSVAQLFGFLGFTGSYFGTDFLDALPTALKVLAACQTVAGVVLLFFLGLGLRNRFRLK